MRLFATEWDPDSTDVSFTPPHIIEAIGLTYDLDPATPPGGVPWIPADTIYTEHDDGLTQPWHGRVWLNPPYSAPAPWIEKLADHGNGVALLPNDSATKWWHQHVTRGDAWCFINGRIRFLRQSQDEPTSARFPSLLVAYGLECAAAVKRCGLGWTVPL